MIDTIAKLHSPFGSLVSVYINRRPPATRAKLVDLLKPLRAAHPDVDKRMRTDLAGLVDMAGRIDTDGAPAVAMFSSSHDRIFEYLPLDCAVEDVATVGPRPLLRPLRARPRPLRVGVMLGDSARALTYVVQGGEVDELGPELTVEKGKDNYGGFGGNEEPRNRARAGELSAQMWRQAGRRLLDAHQDHPLAMLVLGGHEESFDAMGEQFHTYLRKLPRGRVSVDLHTISESELAALVTAEVDKERHRIHTELLGRLDAELGQGGAAVSGLAPVLEAANARAVEHLVVAGPFSKPGVTCDSCRWLGRTGESCPVCATPTFPIDDVVAAAMDATVETGGETDVVSVASRLDAVGVGALLRFKLA